MTNTIKSFYDSIYANDPSIFGHSSVNFLRHVLDTFTVPVGRALDVGAGEGVTSNLLAENGFEVTAIDISDNAFHAVRTELSITTSVARFEDFDPAQDYSLIHIALILHHVSEQSSTKLIQSLKNHTVLGGVHVHRLFTKNSDFYAQSDGTKFYDYGTNLSDLYDGWEILIDERVVSTAATQTSKNEVRQVVF